MYLSTDQPNWTFVINYLGNVPIKTMYLGSLIYAKNHDQSWTDKERIYF